MLHFHCISSSGFAISTSPFRESRFTIMTHSFLHDSCLFLHDSFFFFSSFPLNPINFILLIAQFPGFVTLMRIRKTKYARVTDATRSTVRHHCDVLQLAIVRSATLPSLIPRKAPSPRTPWPMGPWPKRTGHTVKAWPSTLPHPVPPRPHASP